MIVQTGAMLATAPLQQRTFVNLDTIRKGVLAKKLLTVSQRMNLTKGQVMEALKFPASTIDRKISQNEKLTPEQTERFVGLESLIDQVQAMVEESGDPKGFDAAKWLGEWIEQPLPALGGDKPSEYLDTVTGQQHISSLIARMQSGAYA
jgi:putative toxin-antitoxin system antitoxin component (TIGR02293 family)